MACNSSALKRICMAPRFSAKRCFLVVPGIGTMKSRCANSHVNTICAAVADLAAASSCSKSNTGWFFVITSAEKRFIVRRKSPSAYSILALKRPLKKPLPKGLYATKPMCRSAQKSRICTRLALNSTPIPQDFKLPGRCAEVKPKFAFFQEQRERFAIDSVVFAQDAFCLIPKILNTVRHDFLFDDRQ